MIINGFDDETNTIHFDYDDGEKGSGVERDYRAPAIWQKTNDSTKSEKQKKEANDAEKRAKTNALKKKLQALKEAYKNCYFDPDHPADSSQCKLDEDKVWDFIAKTLHMFWFHGMPKKDEQNKKIQCKGIMLHEPGGFTKPQSLVDTLIKNDYSVHFFVDGETGSIYSCLPLNRRAAHCYKCNQVYGKNHCTEGHCKLFETGSKECKHRPASFNDSLLSIEICRSPDSEEGRKIYREQGLPAAVELCAQLCFLFGFDPLARTEDTVVRLGYYFTEKEKAKEEAKNIKEEAKNVKEGEKYIQKLWGIENKKLLDIKLKDTTKVTGNVETYSVPKTLITHREGHIFYRQASNHEDPDTYWMNVFKGLKKVRKDGKETYSVETRTEEKSYGPADFREAVDKKLKEMGKGLQGWKRIHPYLLLLYFVSGYNIFKNVFQSLKNRPQTDASLPMS